MLNVPRTAPTTFRLSDGDRANLIRLQELLGGRRSQTDVVSLALTHLLATVQRDERVHVTIPTEDDEPTHGK